MTEEERRRQRRGKREAGGQRAARRTRRDLGVAKTSDATCRVSSRPRAAGKAVEHARGDGDAAVRGLRVERRTSRTAVARRARASGTPERPRAFRSPRADARASSRDGGRRPWKALATIRDLTVVDRLTRGQTYLLNPEVDHGRGLALGLRVQHDIDALAARQGDDVVGVAEVQADDRHLAFSRRRVNCRSALLFVRGAGRSRDSRC